MDYGKVYLIGAGPGDPELLTLKAVRVLARADVVLIDDLANPEVLAYARRDARIIRVGKRGGCKSAPQAFIERLMVRYARHGKTVARVKGGDPFVFGRGGEELETLEAAGIEVETVSGITSGIGVPAALGVPVTHRGFTHGVALISGHCREDGGAQSPDWAALARSGTTLVIYMGMRNLDAIAAALLAAGMSPEMPAAAIENGTLPNQVSVVSTLARLAQDVEQAGLGSPAVVVIGQVVQMAQRRAFTEPAQRVA